MQQAGASLAVLLYPTAGPLGMVALRLTFAAVILLAVARPSLRGYTRSDWMTVVGFGLALTGMNVLYYLANAHIPIGATSTIELLGPLTLAVIMARTVSGWLSAALAAAGVALLGWSGFELLNPPGVLFALGAAVLWAAYILLSARTGARFAKLDGLAIAMTVGAVVTLPFGVGQAGAAMLDPRVLLIALGIAVLSSAVPYALELIALRRLAPSSFSVLVSLNPAIAALAGFVVLGQVLAVLDWFAILLVGAASALAVGAAARATHRTRGARATVIDPSPG